MYRKHLKVVLLDLLQQMSMTLNLQKVPNSGFENLGSQVLYNIVDI